MSGTRGSTRLPGRGAGLVCLIAVLLPLPAGAQSRIRTDVDTTLVTVGDRMILTVSVEHAPGTTVAWPDSLDLAPFEVLDTVVMPPRSSDGATVTSAAFSLTAFELGELEIPSFEVAVLGPGDAVEVLETDRFGVRLVSVGADETGDIRDIRGPLGIPIGVMTVGLGALLVLVALGLGYGLYRRFGRGDAVSDAGVSGPPPRPAHEVALEALARLEASPILEQGRVKEFHIEVSDILRTYVEGRFQVEALEMTTIEVVAGLESGRVPEDFRKGLHRFLDQCDLVKFAKVRPGTEASSEVLYLGRRLVEDTVPTKRIADEGDEADPGAGSRPVDDGAQTPRSGPTPASVEVR